MIVNHRILSLFAVSLVFLSAFVILTDVDESDAALGTYIGGENLSSESDPYTAVNFNAGGGSSPIRLVANGIYVLKGSSISIPEYSYNNDFHHFYVNSITSGFGLTLSDGSVSGTVSKTGTITVGESFRLQGNAYATTTATIYVVEDTTPVTSISLSGTSTVTIGSTVTITATTSPSSATDRGVTWSIQSGSSYGSIQSTSDTSTGGKCVVKGTSAGTIVLKATASDGSGVSKTISITVEQESYTYTLSYDANGGSGAPSKQTATSTASSYTFTVSYTEPTRSGYTFLGWSTSSSASSPSYYGGDSITSYGSRILYAVWEQETSTFYAYLKYNANGGSGAPGQQSASITAVSASGSKTFTISSTTPTRTGYEFLGWSTSSTATTAPYHPGGTISVAYGSTATLYAVWQQITITISGTPDAYGIVGSSWKFTPTLNVSGCTLSVSGASWLVVSGNSISGTPNDTGTYTITLKATKTGYASGSMTFSITVLSALDFQSSPSGGAIIYAL